ncbi:hypothetical protein NY78_4404 [Desulfovibrio sp. TomC]|nr:hypothetical protein NY78_4404 [Desulfovibrio sp. TomC]
MFTCFFCCCNSFSLSFPNHCQFKLCHCTHYRKLKILHRILFPREDQVFLVEFNRDTFGRKVRYQVQNIW